VRVRRIYESSALDRNDEDPFRPNESPDRTAPAAARTVPAEMLSRQLTPRWLRHRALSVDISTPQTAYPAGTPVPITVRIHNRLPIPIAVETRSPLLWTWHVDGHRDASYVPESLPDEPGEYTFDRGERKRFDRRWTQTFKVSSSEWEPADPGEYVIGAGIEVGGAAEKGLYDETTVRIE